MINIEYIFAQTEFQLKGYMVSFILRMFLGSYYEDLFK